MTTENQSKTAPAGQNSEKFTVESNNYRAEATKEEEEDIEDAGPEGTRQANRLREEEEDRLRAIYGDGDEEATK